ncbi:hypothetical protein [Streptomyces albidoflavus]|uniref:hypothetical protein n=1 Tax=Streptomyces albidoflavus TaxID=1886 RepID=UPI0033F42627
MDTTTFPPHLDDASKAATEAGWEVVRRAKAMVFHPPTGKPVSVRYESTEEEVQEALKAAGLHRIPAQAKPDDAPATPDEQPQNGRNRPSPCPHCSAMYKGPGGLAAHLRAAHPDESQPPASPKTEEDSETRPGPSAPSQLAPTVEKALAALVTALEASGSNQEENKALRKEITSLTGKLNRSRDRVERLKERIEELRADVDDLKKRHMELQLFRDKVRAEVANQNQAPVQAIVNIIQAGGHGFIEPTG